MGSLLALLLVLAIILPLVAILLFKPNDFKPQITSFINEKTGLPLTLKGDIELKLFPWIGLKVTEASLPQPAGFGSGEFITIKELNFKIPLKELLQRQLRVETLHLDGLNIVLKRNNQASTNWQYYLTHLNGVQSTAKDSKETKIAPPNRPKQAKKLEFAINEFNIENAQFQYQDVLNQQNWQVNDLNLTGQSLTNIYPIKADFVLQQNGSTPLQGPVQFVGTVTLQEGLPLIRGETNAAISMPNAVWQKINLTSNIAVDFNKAISFTKLQLHALSSKAQGNCIIPLNNQVPITFKLIVDKLNTAEWLASPSKPSSPQSAPAASKVSTRASVNPGPQTTSRTLMGEVMVHELLAEGLHLNEVKANIKLANNQLNVAPLSANFYQGNLNVQINRTLNTLASTQITGKVTNVAIQPLLRDLKKEAVLSGKANVEFNLAQSTQQTLSGVVKCQMNEGVLEGIDVKYYLRAANALLNKEPLNEQDSKRTPFGLLTATLQLHDRQIDNNDLTITAPDFKATGAGNIDLAQQTLLYKVQAWRQYSDGKEHPNAYPLALRISGPLAHPKVQPDMDLYLKTAVKKELQKEINKQLDKNLNKLLGNPAATNNNGQSEAPSEESPEEKLKRKLGKGVEKGLKKLFKVE